MTIQSSFQQDALNALVELYDIDLTALGGPNIHITPNVAANGTSSVAFGGVTYIPIPIAGTSWQKTTSGASPRPSVKISNVTRFIQPLLTTYDGCIGAKVTRRITLEQYLDAGSTPDSTAVMLNDQYYINQVSVNRLEVEFTLVSILDKPVLKFPPKQVLRAQFPAAGLFRKR